jgi:hypothetical protein
VLQGKAGAGLPETYDAERRPIAAFTVEQAYSRYVRRTAPYLGMHNIAEQVDDLAIELGYRYHSRALDDDGGADLHENPSHPSANPGFRAPHVWIQYKGRRISSIDLLGKDYVVFAGPDGEAWCRAARAVSGKLGIAVDAYRIGPHDDMIGGDSRFAEAYRLAGSAAVLMRPDGFIAWRTGAAEGDAERSLSEILSRILCREIAPAPSRIGAMTEA